MTGKRYAGQFVYDESQSPSIDNNIIRDESQKGNTETKKSSEKADKNLEVIDSTPGADAAVDLAEQEYIKAERVGKHLNDIYSMLGVNAKQASEMSQGKLLDVIDSMLGVAAADTAIDSVTDPTGEHKAARIKAATPIISAKDAMPWEHDAKAKAVKGARKVYGELVSSQHAGERLSKSQLRADSKAVTQADTYQNVRNSRAKAAYIKHEGLTTPSGDIVGGSLTDIIKSMPGEMDNDFQMYLLRKRNAKTSERGKEIISESGDESRAAIEKTEKQHPEYKAAAERLYAWQNQFMDEWAVKTGRISKNAMDRLRSSDPSYVPVYLADNEGSGGRKAMTIKATKLIKKLEGGQGAVLDLREALARRIDQVVKAQTLNDSLINLYKFIEADPKATANYARIAPKADGAAQNDVLADDGDYASYENMRQIRDGVYQAVVYINGAPKKMYLSKEMYDGFSKLARPTEQAETLKIPRRITNTMKQFFTNKNPIFAFRNLTRDLPTYFDNSVAGFTRAAKSLARSVAGMVKNSDEFRQFKAQGGASSGFLSSNKNYTDTFKKKNPARKAAEVASTVLEWPGEKTETLVRFAEYLNGLDKYGNTPDGRIKAMNASAEVTVNFARSGEITKGVDAFVPYPCAPNSNAFGNTSFL